MQLKRSQHTLLVHYLDALKIRNVQCPCLQVSFGLRLIPQSFTAKGRREDVGRVVMVMFVDKEKGR